MNEFEKQVLASIHEIELQVTRELSELRGEISSLRETVERNINTDTSRLNQHSKEIDSLREGLAKLGEWKSQFEKQVSNRIAISQSISTIAAVVITFVLSKFL